MFLLFKAQEFRVFDRGGLAVVGRAAFGSVTPRKEALVTASDSMTVGRVLVLRLLRLDGVPLGV